MARQKSEKKIKFSPNGSIHIEYFNAPFKLIEDIKDVKGKKDIKTIQFEVESKDVAEQFQLFLSGNFGTNVTSMIKMQNKKYKISQIYFVQRNETALCLMFKLLRVE